MRAAGAREPMYIEIDHLSRRFGETVAADGVTLALEKGEILALLGPSGSGKTTILRLLAGFERPDSGRILVEGEDVTELPPVARRFGMVFQHYALFPHLDAGRNVAFGLESLGVREPDLSRRVAAALALVDLSGFERRRIAELSGGQQQRVALARAIAPEPRVLLLDEPLSNLDPALREKTRAEIRQVIERVGITTILVTHEQEEAFDLGDLVAVIRRGRVEQLGRPEELYERPANAFVAGFVGRASTLDAEVFSVGDGSMSVAVEGATWNVPSSSGFSRGDRVRLLIRPEALRIVPPAPGVVRGEVRSRRFTGSQAFYSVVTAAGARLEAGGAPGAARLGDLVGLEPAGRGIHPFRKDGDEGA